MTIDNKNGTMIALNNLVINLERDLESFETYVKNEIIPLIAGKEPPPSDSDPCWIYLKQFGFEYEED